MHPPWVVGDRPAIASLDASKNLGIVIASLDASKNLGIVMLFCGESKKMSIAEANKIWSGLMLFRDWQIKRKA
jgi:chromosome condensin MukBEF MukE localization factor